MTTKPAADGAILHIIPCPGNAPPVATECVPIGVQPFDGAGLISSCPSAVMAFSLTTAMAMMSSAGLKDCPVPSSPAPAPISMPAISYKSNVSVAPLANDRFFDCHPRLAWLSPIPLVSVGL